MNVHFTARGWQDYLHWVETDRAVLGRMNELLKDVRRSPFAGIGKPEPLKGALGGGGYGGSQGSIGWCIAWRE